MTNATCDSGSAPKGEDAQRLSGEASTERPPVEEASPTPSPSQASNTDTPAGVEALAHFLENESPWLAGSNAHARGEMMRKSARVLRTLSTRITELEADKARLEKLIRDWDRWEAFVILDPTAWGDEHGFHVLGEHYDRYIELQEARPALSTINTGSNHD